MQTNEAVPEEPQPDRRSTEGEHSGGNVDYYRVFIAEPKRPEVEPYMAECEDIILALNMTFAEGNTFKAVWRTAAGRMGLKKRGDDAIYNGEKVAHYGVLMVKQYRTWAAAGITSPYPINPSAITFKTNSSKE